MGTDRIMIRFQKDYDIHLYISATMALLNWTLMYRRKIRIKSGGHGKNDWLIGGTLIDSEFFFFDWLKAFFIYFSFFSFIFLIDARRELMHGLLH